MPTAPCLPEMRSSQGTRSRWRGTLKVGRVSVEPRRNPLVYISAAGQASPRSDPDPKRGDGSLERNHRRAGDAHHPWTIDRSGLIGEPVLAAALRLAYTARIRVKRMP